MKHFSTLKEYCKGINISPPKWTDCDVRSFKENMKTVHHKMGAHKHEFYALALKLDGSGYAKTGNYSTKNLRATVFFNSPYQIAHWEILPDWEGYYIMFTEDFFRRENHRKRIGQDFPFLMVDNTVPLEIAKDDTNTFINIFKESLAEHHKDEEFAKDIVFNYTRSLLYRVARMFKNQSQKKNLKFTQRNNDIAVISRFKNLIETSFRPELGFENAEPHKVSFYADNLSIHPNHLNSISKRITSHSASELIYGHILSLAKSRLSNTNKSVKEIAFELYYNYPNHFAKFFKKQTGLTPSTFRKR
ncbi:helix-turn-helix domain-containing protein [Aggregatimonas sangjinii]|uniref:Helix-turn-helix domain-containing protein n=1 Tax=Aggregatimonas sangjinii TaxID=2583587 RepID=A0A5B7SJW9_9FLAO|nr:helix-turn-helix domain-containing protein [Aggregatimonas sangjinii]QCW98865.1 helix-turn-helix domain-containing protein [Aggregatimonas sangjinii]